MKSNHIFISSAFFMGSIGLASIFLPEELATWFFKESSSLKQIPIQMLGAFYFGFAMMNWMSKGLLAGGIYARPIVLGNMTHFAIASLSLIKSDLLFTNKPMFAFIMINIIFALAYSYLFFNTPKAVANA